MYFNFNAINHFELSLGKKANLTELTDKRRHLPV